ncbi:hypothetical protein [Streptomyces sp. NPDC001292]|uniref:hypothetical protein n=1 Tax=Streptomyces sp. NPDC001292 TaxID=3364558 RepID=UPI0036B17AE7
MPYLVRRWCAAGRGRPGPVIPRRAGGRELIDTLLDRLPGLRLAVPADQVAWRRKTMIRGPRTLPVAR